METDEVTDEDIQKGEEELETEMTRELAESRRWYAGRRVSKGKIVHIWWDGDDGFRTFWSLTPKRHKSWVQAIFKPRVGACVLFMVDTDTDKFFVSGEHRPRTLGSDERRSLPKETLTEWELADRAAYAEQRAADESVTRLDRLLEELRLAYRGLPPTARPAALAHIVAKITKGGGRPRRPDEDRATDTGGRRARRDADRLHERGQPDQRAVRGEPRAAAPASRTRCPALCEGERDPRDEPMAVSRQPCKTCPFRRDAPHGIWEPDQYVRIAYLGSVVDHPSTPMGCHQHARQDPQSRGEATPCWGWVKSAPESFGVQLRLKQGMVTEADLEPGPVDVMTPEEMLEANGIEVEYLPARTPPPVDPKNPDEGLLERVRWSQHIARVETLLKDDPRMAWAFVRNDSVCHDPPDATEALGFTPRTGEPDPDVES